MQSDDLLRAGLRRLLRGTPEAPAGTPKRRDEVAAIAGCSADNLYQIAAGTLLPSGAPRSVGRQTRLKLDAAFPKWLDGLEVELKGGPQTEGAAEAEPSVREALRVIRNRLMHDDGQAGELIGEALKLMAKVPDSDRAFEDALRLIEAMGSSR